MNTWSIKQEQQYTWFAQPRATSTKAVTASDIYYNKNFTISNLIIAILSSNVFSYSLTESTY